MPRCPSCDKPGGDIDTCEILNAAYILAGLAMMLNIRLSYSSAPYALIRFRLPENLFSVFVRRMASALELWCLPSMLLGNIIDLAQKAVFDNNTPGYLKAEAGAGVNAANKLRGLADTLYNQANALQGAITGGSTPPGKAEALDLATEVGNADTAPSSAGKPTTLRQALNELGSDNGSDPTKLPGLAKNVKEKYGNTWSGVKSKFYAVKVQNDKGSYTGQQEQYTPVVTAWNAFDKLYHDTISTDKFNITVVPSIISQWLNFLTYVILLVVYVMGGDSGRLTIFYWVIAISGVVFGINMTLVYAVDWQYITVYIAGENCFPILTSFIHYITTLMFGNRRRWNSDFIVVCVDIVVAIIISFAAAVMWTLGYAVFREGPTSGTYSYGHIHAFGFTPGIEEHVVSPFLMIVVGMGLVYAIYPGIAPGMIVPFYLIDKIEMVLLVATIFPPMIVVILQKVAKSHSPKAYGGWKDNLQFWHIVDVLIVIKITLATIFIYSLHYKESSLSRSIINQPKMSTFLSITFYMCHEFLLAIGFAGQISNGAEYVLIPQYIGALFMIFLAFYSEGYIIEYKSHDPAHWPTTAMWYVFGVICRLSHRVVHFPLNGFYYNKA
ncbi:Tpr-related protein family member, putative [Theileria annulata]|uniref:Tpr-related protein family member, putative n=1 Tax=Theileria annulata TaxID=5874 RepID=Q4U9K8_THEAN|nr:Tpr-related protein family member, putative [Theileria annulata]CAI76495.1 Tpr-related protein family member, putative [Theileria annulata]|eukprot:XP_953120.1 Tpr-related protein family member, putative [Theileria annulata]